MISSTRVCLLNLVGWFTDEMMNEQRPRMILVEPLHLIYRENYRNQCLEFHIYPSYSPSLSRDDEVFEDVFYS